MQVIFMPLEAILTAWAGTFYNGLRLGLNVGSSRNPFKSRSRNLFPDTPTACAIHAFLVCLRQSAFGRIHDRTRDHQRFSKAF